MFLPALFDFQDKSLKITRINELLGLNEELKKHNILLTPEAAGEIIESRSAALKNQGRVELDIEVTKTLIKTLSSSEYINQKNFVCTVNKIYEVFHFIKNATSDFTSDEENISAIMVYYNKVCGGSCELLMGKGIEKILQNFNQGRNLSYIDAKRGKDNEA